MKKDRINKRYFYILSDTIITFAVIVLSFVSHYGVDEFTNQLVLALSYSGTVALTTIVAFYFAGVYRIIISDIGIRETIRISLIILIVNIAGLIGLTIAYGPTYFISFFLPWIAGTVFLLYLLPLSRLAYRIYYLLATRIKKEQKIGTLIIGAGSTGKVVMDEVRRNPRNKNVVYAFVDDNPNKIGGLFQNIDVKGPISEIKTIIEYTGAQEVIIAISTLSDERLHEILALLRETPVRVKRMPLLSEMEGPNDKRIIDVDLNDLLKRLYNMFTNTSGTFTGTPTINTTYYTSNTVIS